MAKLAAYKAKRDFKKTAEPEGRVGGAKGSSFVVQKHAASRLHYDLRLELDGVMKSWAVAKGPSLVPGEKRLAVHVEDHPIEYNSFEGTIPKGQYGGGTVLLWDRGTWAAEGDARRGYAKGHLDFSLAGEKLHGAWHLVRMKKRPGERQEAWLLIKSDDEFARAADAPDILDEEARSVASGRTLDEIARDAGSAVWNSNRGLAAEERAAADEKQAVAEKPKRAAKAKAVAPSEQRAPVIPSEQRAPVIPSEQSAPVIPGERSEGRGPKATRRKAPGQKAGSPSPAAAAPPPAGDDKGARAKGRAKRSKAAAPAGGKKAPMPSEMEPCLATLTDAVPKGDRWVHEIKWDGYRLIGFVSDGRARLTTRRGHDWTHRFPRIAQALAALPVETAILDGEAVVEDEGGVSSFSALQNALSDAHHGIADAAFFYAFDLLYRDGIDLRPLPLEERKARLAELVPPGAAGDLRLSEHLDADGAAMVRSACQLGLEGVISKRRDRPYRSGRGEDWLKVKCTERQEFVIAGMVPSSATPKAVGSLVLGYNEGGRLLHAGRTGTGFTGASARELWARLAPARVQQPPFADKLNAMQRRDVVWLTPELVAEVEFRGWTADRHLRHAAFKGLREDKLPAEVVREVPKGGAKSPSKPVQPARTPALVTSSEGGTVAGVALTNPDRVLWEDCGVTKRYLAEFYEEIASWILPHVAERPLSLVRCPTGWQKGCFFQKHSWAGLGDHILRDTVRDEGGEEEVLFVRDIRGIVSLVQAGVMEIHPWGARIGDVDRPDRITMDLDPDESVAWPLVIEAAQEVRRRLGDLGLESFVKSTGGKGLHVVVPLTPDADWDRVKAFAHGLAEAMERDSPARYLSKSVKAARKGKIYVDYLRNGRGATAIAAYSSRARAGAAVSVPFDWDELSAAIRPNHFTVANLGQRLDRLALDPWAEMTKIRQRLPTQPAGHKNNPGRRRR